jgi:hypothetical protein
MTEDISSRTDNTTGETGSRTEGDNGTGNQSDWQHGIQTVRTAQQTGREKENRKGDMERQRNGRER